MIAYTSRCSGATADALRDAGWRFLLSPGSRPATPYPGMGWALDNGAWSCHTQGTAWDAEAFASLVARVGAGADWIAAPDVVCGGAASLALSLSWLPRLAAHRVLIPVQDGMTGADLAPVLGPRVGIFVGGSTEWKLSSLGMWGAAARRSGCWLHVARVNTERRIRMCLDVGATSFDGSSPARFRVNLARLDRARRSTQEVMLWS